MNNDRFFLGYRVSCGVSLRFSLLTQCMFPSCLGKLQLLQGRFLSGLPPRAPLLEYLPQSLGESPRKILPDHYYLLFGRRILEFCQIYTQTLKVQPCILWFLIIPSVLILSLLYWCEEKSSSILFNGVSLF
ncbi:hypothetical protein HJG60_008565 [Phyllostomus discolor]|uniref:Uncharacterized protein n=1 Tax=Phyllostomus discolor TaxID=89673 RepID=A0A833YSU8_9CHIR|nr:hypothetical protein HJG60_008565 [Phyllostomus discolor]